jgi:ribosomal protein S18 acetylase RimI-like enzyme
MSELVFQQVGGGHLATLIELFERNAAVAAVGHSFDPFPLTEAQARAIALEPRRDAYYLALAGGRALGMSMLRGFDEGYEIPSFGIFVDHEQHARGIGRALTVWTIEQARLRSCRAVRLSVYSDNAPARGLYESLGFEEQERVTVVSEGGTREKLVMRLELAP